MEEKIIISLFDLTGNWSKPWREGNYKVIQIDIQKGQDILSWEYKKIAKEKVYGIMASCPCTDFALSGAKHFAKKDKEGETEKSKRLVYKTKEIIEYFKPKFWVIENPMSRIHKCCPEIGEVKYKFNPCDFAGYLKKEEQEKERYNKQTWLWGEFKEPIKKRMEPLEKEFPGWKKYGGKSIKTKNERSKTPIGFAYAFYEANKEINF